MAYNNQLAKRLQELPNIEEKEMMGGLVFMLNDKMCMGIIKDERLCRIDPERHETEMKKRGCSTMDFTKRLLKGYVLVDETGMKTREDFEHWITLCLEFNSKAKSSKKKKG